MKKILFLLALVFFTACQSVKQVQETVLISATDYLAKSVITVNGSLANIDDKYFVFSVWHLLQNNPQDLKLKYQNEELIVISTQQMKDHDLIIYQIKETQKMKLNKLHALSKKALKKNDNLYYYQGGEKQVVEIYAMRENKILVDFQSEMGDSGMPFYDSEDNLVGILSGYEKDNPRTATLINLANIL